MKMDDQPLNNDAEFDEGEKKVPRSLKGSVIRYENPFEPAVPQEDWESLREVSDSSNPA
jgi:hypothetical protein